MPLTLVSAFHMQLGSFSKVTPVFLAPMAGVTDRPFRQLCKKFGAGMAVSEMVTSNSLLYGSEKTLRGGSLKRRQHY